MPDILSLTQEELTEEIIRLGLPTFRAKQIFSWLHSKKSASFEEMTDLPKDLRKALKTRFNICGAKVLKAENSFKDDTRKYLLELPNATIIESVLMTYEYGSTLCVSSQNGCKMGCSFCASGLNGFVRNLSPGEMLSQIYEIEKHSGKKISRCVIMGQGEPFDNFTNTVKFINIINSKSGHNMGMRNITVSTCGIVPKIREFADLNTQVNLAVSLHAPNDNIRKRLIKIASVYDFDSLMDACGYYIKKTNRRITFEYALIDGINDGGEHALLLGERLKGLLCHVNLIPLNSVDGIPYKRSENTEVFEAVLRKRGINATVRRELGGDIDGACGQLKNRAVKELSNN